MTNRAVAAPKKRVTRTVWNEDSFPLEQNGRVCKSHRRRVTGRVDLPALECY